MFSRRSLFTIPLALVALAWPLRAPAATIRDDANLFSSKALSQARGELERIESETRIPATIETIASLEGNDIRDVTDRHNRASRAGGLYILIAKKEGKIQVEAEDRFKATLSRARTDAIRDAFVASFKKREFDAGLAEGVRTIGLEASQARSEHPARTGSQPGVLPPQRRVNTPPPRTGGFGLGSVLGIGLLIVGVLFVFRLLGAVFGGNRGYGGPRPGAWGQPGYGGGGGGGGGFMSSLFGGIGGALAGNWLYDQFSDRHRGGGYVQDTTYDPGADPNQGSEAGGTDWSGGGSTGDWGGDSGNDGGGGSGGDWGGGGGDWGGGGGDSGGSAGEW